ncbi:MAG: hypothetical protein PHH06_04025 [Candidatus Gracilibacteria bacterium]|nr:hypothetical protein [Candidatus Gracilibacteria bacterium]
MQKKYFKIEDSIYYTDMVLQAIEDFKEVSNISLDNGQISIEGETLEDVEEIFNELMNYVIGLYNQSI